MKYRSCAALEHFLLGFRMSNTGAVRLQLCFEAGSNVPGIAFCETADNTVKNFIRERANIISESIKFSLLDKLAADEERVFTSRCAKCSNFQLNNWGGKYSYSLYCPVYISLAM